MSLFRRRLTDNRLPTPLASACYSALAELGPSDVDEVRLYVAANAAREGEPEPTRDDVVKALRLLVNMGFVSD
jgi:hypothetical protein